MRLFDIDYLIGDMSPFSSDCWINLLNPMGNSKGVSMIKLISYKFYFGRDLKPFDIYKRSKEALKTLKDLGIFDFIWVNQMVLTLERYHTIR